MAFGTVRNLRFNRWLFTRMIRFGLPSGLHWFLDVAAFTVFVLLVGRLGPIAHIASNIALSINLIAFMPMIGMGMAAAILVGQYLGRNQPEHAERMGWLALKVGVGYVAAIGVTFLLFPAFYTNVFEGDAVGSVPFGELLKAVRILLVMLAIWGVADAVAIIISGALKGAGDTHFVMYFQSVVAWGFLVLGQLDSAEVMARAHDAILVEPSDPPLLPDILMSQGRASEAIRVAEEWARHRYAGGSAHAITVAYLQLADLLIRAGDPARAIAPLDQVDSLAHESNAVLDVVLPATGTYLILASDASADHTGNYRVSVQRLSDREPVTPI